MTTRAHEDVATSHIRQGLAALIRERDDLDLAIAQAQTLLMGRRDIDTPVARPIARGGSTRAIILALLSDEQTHQVRDILDGVSEAGIDSSENAVRSLVAKMVRDGSLVNPSRGIYRRNP